MPFMAFDPIRGTGKKGWTNKYSFVIPATISGNTVTFSITDGGLGDDGLTVNGTIVGRGRPGVPAGTSRHPGLVRVGRDAAGGAGGTVRHGRHAAAIKGKQMIETLLRK